VALEAVACKLASWVSDTAASGEVGGLAAAAGVLVDGVLVEVDEVGL
jgi:hypothetical protein